MSTENMKIEIFNYTNDVEKVCAAAAKMSTTEGTCTDVYDGITDIEEARKTLSRIVKLGHVTVLEHGYFNIMFENVSLFFEQFLIEHRLSAYTIKSGRYVDFRKAGCYEPEFRYYNDVQSSVKEEVKNEYMNFVSESFDLYKKMADAGVKVEDARFVLPYSLKTNIYCSMNTRELVHLIWAMLHGRGANYPEIVEIGNRLKEELNNIAPTAVENILNIEKGKESKEEKLNELLGAPKFNPVEDNSKKELIEIINITPNPEKVIAMSAIVKNKQYSYEKIEEMLEDDNTLMDKILDIVFEDKRKRELEQVNITFRINDIPLILLKHQVRHRLQDINIPSFTEIANTNRYTYPPSIVEMGEEYVNLIKEFYSKASKLYEKFQEIGIYKEDLTYLFLHAKNVDIVTTMNARTLYHISNLRNCKRAQWKMQMYYKELINKLREVYPNIFKRFGPSCFTRGYCPEGKLTCGKIDLVKKEYTYIKSHNK